MHRIISILFFFKKLILPSFSMAVALAFLEGLLTQKFLWTSIGIYYILMSMFFHYFFYEKLNPGKYYFCYNMGLSKLILWGSSLFLSLIIVLIVMGTDSPETMGFNVNFGNMFILTLNPTQEQKPKDYLTHYQLVVK
jgi:hypothetical protein